MDPFREPSASLVTLRRASLWELWPDVLALVLFAVAMMSLAVTRFR